MAKRKKLKVNNKYFYTLDIESFGIPCDDGSIVQETYLGEFIKCDNETKEIVERWNFRTIKEFVELAKEKIKGDVFLMYAHNLDYELTFLLLETGASSTFIGDVEDIYGDSLSESVFRDNHAPISIRLDVLPNIIFRCSYALSNKSLKELAKDVGMEKLEFDHEILRTPYDKLSKDVYKYNSNDNTIVAEYIFKLTEERNEKLSELPLTFTACTKKDRKKFISMFFGSKNIEYLNIDKTKVVQDERFYYMLLDCYQGGLTTANKFYTNKEITNGVFSIDITSDYPFQMVDKRYPRYYSDTTYYLENEDANNYFKDYLINTTGDDLYRIGVEGYLATITFYDLEIKNPDYLLTVSNAHRLDYYDDEESVKSSRIVNGKIYYKKNVTFRVTDVDYETIKLTYNFSKIEVHEIMITHYSRRLRFPELSFILNGFKNKQELKALKDNGNELTEEQKLLYSLSKVYINSMYGVKVTKPLKDSYRLVNGEIEKVTFNTLRDDKKKKIYENFVKKNKENKNILSTGNFDIFSDGVYVTAYARNMLVKMMIELTNLGCQCVYSDTDSIKFFIKDMKKVELGNGTTNSTEYDNFIKLTSTNIIYKFIKENNKKIKERNKENPVIREFFDKFKVSKENQERVLGLGTWDIENLCINNKYYAYPLFITFGAKKYGYIDYCKGENGEILKKIKTTIAGCSKDVSKAIVKYCERNNLTYEQGLCDVFQIGTQFDESCSGRTEAKREKRSRDELQYLRYAHNGKLVLGSGGITINKTTYTLGLSDNDFKELEVLKIDDVTQILNSDGILTKIGE